MSKPLFAKLPKLLHGGDYNPEQWLDRPDILKQDIQWMREAGVNTVTLGVFSWSTYEPVENEFHFDWLLQIMDALFAAGIYTVLATPTGARPAWLDAQYPSALRVRRNGVRNRHGVRHNHCMSSPDFRARAAEILTHLAHAAGRHPGLILWHVSNELGGECLCPLCARRFQTWLAERFDHDIGKLNKAWWTTFWSHTYNDFSQIEPPFDNGETSIHGLNLAWQEFNTWNMTDYLRFEIETLRPLTPDIPFTTNFMRMYEGLDYAKLAPELDIIAWDSYPLWGDPAKTKARLASEVAFDHAQMRGFAPDKPFLLMESTPSLVNWHPYNQLKRPDMHRLTSLQAIACGADSVQYFQWRKGRGSFEQYHGAVIDHLGRNDTRVFQDVKALGATLNQLTPVVGSTVKANAALVFDWPSRWAIGDMAAMSRDRGYEAFCYEQYEAFTRNDVELDVVSPQSDWDGYQLLVLPMLYLLKEEFAQRLKEFIRRGGYVAATFLTGYVNEHTLCYTGGFPGAGLSELFGLRVEEMDTLYPSQQNATVLPFGDDTAVPLIRFCEIVRPEGAEVLARYNDDFYAGAPVVTRNAFGKGQAWYVAARMDVRGMEQIYRAMLDACGIANRTLPEGVGHHMRQNDTHRFDFYLNHSDIPVTVHAARRGLDLLTGRETGDILTLNPLGVPVVQSALS